MQIDASAKADEFLTLLEAVSTAVSNPTIDKETTPKLIARRLEKLKRLEADAAYIADKAAAKRLFGKFPYGRPELGTTETVAKLGFADVLEAKQRFLTSDNATVSISVADTQAFPAATRISTPSLMRPLFSPAIWYVQSPTVAPRKSRKRAISAIVTSSPVNGEPSGMRIST